MAIRILLYIILIGFYICYLAITPSQFSNITFDLCALTIILGMTSFISYSQRGELKNCWFKPSNLFLLAFLIVNFQFLLDYRLGLKTDSSRYILYPDLLNHCLILGVLGFISYVLGYMLKPIAKTVASPSVKIRPYSLAYPLAVFNVLMFFAFIATIDVFAFITGAVYGQEDTVNTYIEGLLYTSNVLIIVYVCVKCPEQASLKQYIRSFPFVSLVIILMYMTLRLFSGDRGPFLYTLILLYYGYVFVTKNKFSFKSIIAILLAGMTLLTIVGIARNEDTSDSLSDRIENSVNLLSTEGRFEGEKSVFPLTEELGFSFLVNQVDVNAIENRGAEYNYGLYTLNSLLICIPKMPSYLYQNYPAEKVTSTSFANHYFFGKGGGTWSLGSTVLADFYLQWGAIGVIVGLFIIGMFMKYLDCILFLRNRYNVSQYLLLIVLLFSSYAIYIPRATLLMNLKDVVPAATILFLSTLLTRNYKKR